MRGRERERGDVRVCNLGNRFFHRSPARRSPSGIPFSRYHHRLPRVPPRGPVANQDNRYISDRTGRLGKRLFAMKEPHDGASGWGEEKNRHPNQRDVSREKPFKKSFRELFSEQDVVEGGKWVEVKRRRQRSRPRYRSPIIKNPCFKCGLGGHFRRNCPQRMNMKCFGCNSPFHLMRDCPVIQRPQELKVDLLNVFDINEKVESLSKFAIFRTRDKVNIHALRTAMCNEFWEFNWQGKIYPIDNNSFLVGFVDELHRDQAVLAGRKQYDGFSGTLYAWDENRGAVRVLRPVIIWLTLEGLPLHFWGKEEIKTLVSPFGKIHKFGENFYLKKRADVVKVMVEVDDMSLVPKTIECSYKGIRDNKYRFYIVNLIPAATCLPVSQWTEDNYKSYEELGGSGDDVEEGWSEGRSRRGDAARRREEDAGERGSDDGAVNMPINAMQNLGVHAQAGKVREVALNMPINARQNLGVHAQAQSEEHWPAGQKEDQGGEGDQVHERELKKKEDQGGEGDQVHERELKSIEEGERRRKGKGILIGSADQPWFGRQNPNPVLSGSGSCDPLEDEAQKQRDPLPSDDADSKAGWSEGRSRRGDAARRREEDAGEGGSNDGEVNMPVNAGQNLGVHAQAEVLRRGAQSGERWVAGQKEDQGGDGGQIHERALMDIDEEGRRRKGKGIMTGVLSGSGSCDPLVKEAHKNEDPLTSDDADSKAGPAVGVGLPNEVIVLSEDSEDVEMEEGGRENKEAFVKGGVEVNEVAAMELHQGFERAEGEGGQMKGKGEAVEHKRSPSRQDAQRGMELGRDSTLSVPAGF